MIQNVEYLFQSCISQLIYDILGLAEHHHLLVLLRCRNNNTVSVLLLFCLFVEIVANWQIRCVSRSWTPSCSWNVIAGRHFLFVLFKPLLSLFKTHPRHNRFGDSVNFRLKCDAICGLVPLFLFLSFHNEGMSVKLFVPFLLAGLLPLFFHFVIYSLASTLDECYIMLILGLNEHWESYFCSIYFLSFSIFIYFFFLFTSTSSTMLFLFSFYVIILLISLILGLWLCSRLLLTSLVTMEC